MRWSREGLGFYRTICGQGEWQESVKSRRRSAVRELNVTMVMLWLPGMNKHRMLSDIVHEAPELWQRR